MADLNAIKNKLAKLAKMTVENGCSEAEALNAAQRMTEILEENGLTLADIKDRIKTGDVKEDLEFGVFGDKGKLHEVQYAAQAVADYFDCQVFSRTLYVDGKNLRVISYFGFKQDVAAAMILTQTLRLAMEADYATFAEVAKKLGPALGKNTHGKTLRAGFMRGFCSRVSERLREMKRASQAKKETGTALVVVKNQVVKQALAEQGMRFSKGQASAVRDSGAYAAGRAAGDRANLNGNAAQVGQTRQIGAS